MRIYPPFTLIFKIWNPFKLKDLDRNLIRDIRFKRKAQKISDKIRQSRRENGQPERMVFKCELRKSVGFSGKED